MKEIKDSPKNKLEMFSFLNALLVQFQKQNGFTFYITHSTTFVETLHDFITIRLNFPETDRSCTIVIDLDDEDEIRLDAKFAEARTRIPSFTKLTDKAKKEV